MDYPDDASTPQDPSQTLGADDPPEDDDDPPEVVTGEGGTIRPRDVRIRIISPKEGQSFIADANGQVKLDLHGKVTYIKSNGDLVSLPDRFYKWSVDQDPTVILTGAQGTAEVRLATGKHDVVLSVGAGAHSNSVTIEVAPSLAPPPDAEPEPEPEPQPSPSLLQRIINFFRRLFGLN